MASSSHLLDETIPKPKTKSKSKSKPSFGNQEEPMSRFSKPPFPFLAPIFLILVLVLDPVLGQDWDGVIVTQSDYQSLQALRHELDDPKGFLRSWNDSGYGACSGGWAGIKCAQGQVIVIQLPWKGLGGRISDKIGQLQALRKLSLHDNAIGGSIPSSLGFLPSLRGVQLFNNRLSGSVPPSIGSSPLLQNLDLSNNLLSGAVPQSLLNSTRLYRLNLSFNSFSGSIPVSLTGSNSIIFLDLSHNNLSGSIHPGGFSGKLQSLVLDHNSLSGGIPDSIGRLSELREIDLSHNLISGVIPVEIGRLSDLRSVDFSFNSINGSLPSSFSDSIVSLNLESNRLGSQIPEGINRLSKLKVLNLKNNNFVGHVPETIGEVSGLTQLDLSQNNISGAIPGSISGLRSLSLFNVSYNNLSGAVPAPLSLRFNESSFIGNIGLCGFSGSSPCPSEPPSSSPSSDLTPLIDKQKRGSKLSTKDIILIAAGALLLVLLSLCLVLLCLLMRRKRSRSNSIDVAQAKASAAATRTEKGIAVGEAEGGGGGGGEGGGKLVHFDGPMVFTADDLLCATAEIMGKSTYGTVYKATLEDGSQVAVKRLREKITKGQKEFESEVNVLGKIRHPNLLAMRAYYLGPKGEKLLVFDYMPNGSLASFLHARGPDTPVDWRARMKIAQGMTRGLLYLHTTPNIIHGNLTSSNILLDEHESPKIADFGLSRLMTAAANSNVIATAGALGYRAPELSKLKKANSKTDVYSLGVIILELLTGKSPGEAMNGVDLPQWVASIVKEEGTNEVFDLELMRDATMIGNELVNTLEIALHCVDPTPSARPEVHQVLQQLEEIRPEVTSSSGDDHDVAGAPSTSE